MISKKRTMSLFLTAAMCFSTFSGIAPAFADNANRTVLMDFDMESEENKAALLSKSHLFTKAAPTVYTSESTHLYTEDETYGIGTALKNGSSFRTILFDTPINRASDEYKDKYLEVEYDMYSYGTDATTTGAASVVLHAEDGTKALSGLEFNDSGKINDFWNRSIKVDFNFKQWYRCKFVIHLNDNGTVPVQNNFEYYVDGVHIGTGSDYKSHVEAANGMIYGLRLYSSSADFVIDNIKISLCDSETFSADKGALVKAIRDFEKTYNASENTQAASLFAEIEAVYNDDNATEEEVTAAIDKLEAVKSVLYTPVTEHISLDFEGEEAQSAFNTAIADYSNNDVEYRTDGTYDIGTSAYNSANRVLYPINPVIDRNDDSSKNLYLELEYDMKLNYINTEREAIAAVTVVSWDGSAYKHGGGIEFYSKPEHSANGKIAGFWTHKTMADYEVGKWYRLKMVMLLNDNGTLNNTGTVTYYINGEEMLTDKIYSNGFEEAQFIRLYASYSQFEVDNISLKTYKASNPAVEKGKLITKMRDFTSEYTDYADVAEAKALFDEAEAVYNLATATDADVEAAMAKLDEAADAVSKITEYFSYDFETADVQSAFNTAIKPNSNSTVTYKQDDTYGIGTSAYNSANRILIPIEPVINREDDSSKNLYLELEYDMKLNYINTEKEAIAAVTLVSWDGNTYKQGGGVEFYAKAGSAANGKIAGFWTHKPMMDYEIGKWYRIKTVMNLNEDGTLSTANNLVHYINGEKALTDRIYKDDFIDAQFVRLYASNSNFDVDNISVKTFRESNPPTEKGVLISVMREFCANYPGYADMADAKALFDEAEQVYLSKDATNEDVLAAIEKINQAEAIVFPATKLVNEDFEKSPAYFFDKVNTDEYSADLPQPAEVSYAEESIYATGNTLVLAADSAVKNFAAKETGVVSAVFDIKSAADAVITFTDGTSNAVTYNLNPADWTRVKIDADLDKSTYSVWLNGENKINVKEFSSTVNEISAFGIASDAEVYLDNVQILHYESGSTAITDKSQLVTLLRKTEKLVASGAFDADEMEIINNTVSDGEILYSQPVPSASETAAVCKRLNFLIENLSAEVSALKEIIIPGRGEDLENVVVNFNLHYDDFEQGVENPDAYNETFREIFFDGETKKDFSDIRFIDHNGKEIDSKILSHGNYDFVYDKRLGKQVLNLSLSDGTLVTKKDGYVQLSSDNAETWTKTVGQGSLIFVDRNDNIYFADESAPDASSMESNGAGLYKMSPDDNYTTAKLVIDNSDVYEQGVTTNIRFQAMAQDDDGYLYAGRYTEKWIGAALYVSDESGENFRIVDHRPDKQHVHSITVNRNVYPNEVYVAYDDSGQSPLNHMTTDHGGYEEIKDNPDFAHPTAARGLKADGVATGNEASDIIIEHSLKHFKQVPSPYRACDFMGYFGIIDESEDKFYTAQNGKKYTTSDNVYALGYGEANILGGPALYKTTNVWSPKAYYPLIQNAQGARSVVETTDGVLLWGGLSGRSAMTVQTEVSYDKGETWHSAFSEGYVYSEGAGNGVGRSFSNTFVPKGSSEEQIIMSGYGYTSAVRAAFGGEHYYGYAEVKIPYLPADGMKIYLDLNNEPESSVSYEYTLLDDAMAIKSIKNSEGAGDMLKLPVSPAENEKTAYLLDVKTVNKTAVGISLAANNGIKDGYVLKMIARTDNGEIYNALTDAKIGQSDAIMNDTFRVKLVTDNASGVYDVYIGDVKVAQNVVLNTEFNIYTDIVLETLDFSGESTALTSSDYDVPTESAPIEVYYSNISYGTVNDTKEQFIVTDVALKQGADEALELAKGVTLESVTIDKIDAEIDGAVMIAVLRNADGSLAKCELVPVNSSGTYPVNLTAEADLMTYDLYMFKDMVKLMPAYFTYALDKDNTDSQAYVVNYDLNSRTDGEAVSKVKYSSELPYAYNEQEKSFFGNDNASMLEPVFRLKLDEGMGRTITETVSGRSAQIVGDDYEWIENANIRFGSAYPINLRSKTALKLNTSYVELGTFEDLNITDEATFVFWTNYEVEGRNDDYVEPEWHNSLTYASFGSAYKYDKTDYNIILQSGDIKMGLFQNNLVFHGLHNNGRYWLRGSLVSSNQYNMHFAVVRKVGDEYYISTYGNDDYSTDCTRVISNWGTKTLGQQTLYLGTPEETTINGGKNRLRSSQLGIADIMIFDRALNYEERLKLYYGYNHYGFYDARMGDKE